MESNIIKYIISTLMWPLTILLSVITLLKREIKLRENGMITKSIEWISAWP